MVCVEVLQEADEAISGCVGYQYVLLPSLLEISIKLITNMKIVIQCTPDLYLTQVDRAICVPAKHRANDGASSTNDGFVCRDDDTARRFALGSRCSLLLFLFLWCFLFMDSVMMLCKPVVIGTKELEGQSYLDFE